MMANLLFAESSVPVALFIVLGIIVVFLAVLVCLVPIRLWFQALVSGAYISMARLAGMKLRKVDVKNLVYVYIKAKKAGLNFSIDEMETHYLASGNVDKVVDALIAAHSANIALPIDVAKGIDLAGRDILEAVRYSVDPHIIDIPPISAIACDGVELKVSSRATVRVNISRLIGGAGEETVIARIGEGIVATVGAAIDHKDVLQNPSEISKHVLEKGLDSGTAYEILSVDISDIDVGRNVGAELRSAQAEADKSIAQAKAEERKAMAIAVEQEMKAKTQEMKAVVLAAEAEVPKAMAEAFKNGKLGIMDYYRMQNVVADTAMRNSIAGSENAGNEDKN